MDELKLDLRDFHRIVFFTGAGLSAESGIPTYRGHGGVWAEYNYEDFACQQAFLRDPEKVWDFHDKRRAKVAACEPNAGHRAIAEVQRTKPETVIITQNIDGLHQRAGATNVIELHGSLWRVRCEDEDLVVPNDQVPIEPRRCTCGAYWRPDIVWFGDMLDPGNIERAIRALQKCDLLISVGTSGVVYPAADLPRIAMESGATTIEINLEDTRVSRLYQHRIRHAASAALAALTETPIC
ncbi:MAG: NAD-dependent deacylase [Candidatus Hydrogenedentes bacterium]|nr:NAD-dependent deacylase [Candidatus Hydrogenedentota bacterium]